MERLNKQANFGLSEMAKPKETVSLAGVFVFLGLLFLIFVSFLIYLRFSNLSPLSEIYHKKAAVLADDTLSIADQIKVSSPQSLHLKISEETLKNAIFLGGSNFPLKNASLSIKPEGVFISGKSSEKLWAVPVDVKLMPKAENGKLLFDIVEIKTLGITAPAKLTSNLSEGLASRLGEVIPAKSKVVVLSTELALGYIRIEGKQE